MHLLIPDVLVPRAHAHELLAGLELPGLQTLLHGAEPIEREAPMPEFQRTTPATRWLMRAFGHDASSNAAPIARCMAAADGFAAEGNDWFLAVPSHFALARDHVQLGAYAPRIDAAAARILFDTASTALSTAGGELVWVAPERWYYRNTALAGLVCAEPARAIGRNIDVWLPESVDAREPAPARIWRRLHNEVQMLWHEHRVNQERESRGEPAINALWLYGNAAMERRAPGTPPGSFGARPDRVAPRPDQFLLDGLAALADVPRVRRESASDALVLLDELAPSAAREDWSEWRIALALLEREWFAPLATAGLPVTLTLGAELSWETRRHTRRSAWKFWRARALADMLSR